VPVSSAEFESISPGLPAHQDEVMAAHQGAPSIAVQNATHGAPAPPVDNGTSDQVKYGSVPVPA
jgi:hypothetical protein